MSQSSRAATGPRGPAENGDRAETDRREPGQDEEALLVTMLGQLERYLDSDALFQPVVLEQGERLQRHTLTLASLLERLGRLEAEFGPARVRPLRRDLRRLAELRRKAMTTKLRKEMKSNLHLWRAFVRDLEQAETEPDAFAVQRRHRTRFEHLGSFAEGLDIDWRDLQSEMSDLDRRLREQLDLEPSPPGEPSAAERRAFPPRAYWWMYVEPAEA